MRYFDCHPGTNGDAMYLIVWEFWPKRKKEREFARVYGPEGEWVTFFRKGVGYLDTLLCEDLESMGRYMTIDRWNSREAYDTFCRLHREEYDAIDRRCENLTGKELLIGRFEVQENSLHPKTDRRAR